MNHRHLQEVKKIKKTLTIILFILLVAFSIWYVEFNFLDFINAIPTFFHSFLLIFFHQILMIFSFIYAQ